jgi:stress-induced morphogen
MSIAATIREKLMIALRPTRLDVINESHVHAGHQSSPGTGERNCCSRAGDERKAVPVSV